MKSCIKINHIVKELAIDSSFTTAMICIQPRLEEVIVLLRIFADLREMDGLLMWIHSLLWFSEMQGAELVLRIYYLHYKRCHKALWKNRLWKLVQHSSLLQLLLKKRLNVSALFNSLWMSAAWEAVMHSHIMIP